MAITIKVIGIFFEAKLELDKDTPVRAVLEAAYAAAKSGAIPNVKGFDFRVDEHGHSLVAFRATYDSPFQGRKVAREYPGGEYYMAEDVSKTPAYSVWQYYVLDASGRSVTDGRVRFISDPEAIVPAGGSLVWRLVSILQGPNPAPRAVSNLLAI